ncbi:hypothetical protein [Intrasporangium flavum]|uniref:hypothetical protein n=1 Tax=Intrasporangium flavum TaxID=1428657 RepID=UPI001A95E7E6|nr:hypothetical protein [Intrasporangium flavum]
MSVQVQVARAVRSTQRPARDALRWALPVFVVTRAVDAVFMAVASRFQVSLPPAPAGMFTYAPKPADPGLFGVLTNWDGQWYQFIAEQGYQVPAPGEHGAADALWAWQFPPLYPFLVRALMVVTRMDFPHAAATLSLLAGAAAMVVLYLLLERAGGRRVARTGVLLANLFVSAPILGAAYSASLSLLLLLSCLYAVSRHRYGAVLVLLVLLSLTRLITPPFAVVIAVHWYLRERGEQPSTVTRRQRVLLGASAVYSVVGAFTWLSVGAAFIGPANGFARTEGQRSMAFGWFGASLRELDLPGLLGVVVLVSLTMLYAVSRRSSSWGVEMRAWFASYPFFLAAATSMHPGILRYLLMVPTLPMVAAPAATLPVWARRSRLGVLVVIGLFAQYCYVRYLLVIPSHVAPVYLP